MDKPVQNIQDSFLNAARKERLSLTVFLLGGVKLTGRIRSFDKYCLVLETGSMEQMIFKHAISTIGLQRSAMRDHGERSAGPGASLHPAVTRPAPPAAVPAAEGAREDQDSH